MTEIKDEWPLYEIFVRGKRGLNHVHVGSLHAADDQMALRHARDVYTRRNEGVSIWAVRADAIAASSPDEKDPLFAPSGDKVYRHPTFYSIPDDVPNTLGALLNPTPTTAASTTTCWAPTPPTGPSAPTSRTRSPVSTPRCPRTSTRPRWRRTA